MTRKILVTIGLLIIGALAPALEISDTHVFNPDWPPHARFHEVWQLITNATIASLGLWRVWARGGVIAPAILGTVVMGGVIGAHALSGAYGGSISYPGGPQATLFNIHIAVAIPAVAIALFVIAIQLERLAAATARA